MGTKKVLKNARKPIRAANALVMKRVAAIIKKLYNRGRIRLVRILPLYRVQELALAFSSASAKGHVATCPYTKNILSHILDNRSAKFRGS
jgi:hypothetical protein